MSTLWLHTAYLVVMPLLVSMLRPWTRWLSRIVSRKRSTDDCARSSKFLISDLSLLKPFAESITVNPSRYCSNTIRRGTNGVFEIMFYYFWLYCPCISVGVSGDLYIHHGNGASLESEHGCFFISRPMDETDTFAIPIKQPAEAVFNWPVLSSPLEGTAKKTRYIY